MAPPERSEVRLAFLNEGDDDPVRFWTYLIGALETLPYELGDTVHAMLRSSTPPWETVISFLIDALAAVPFDFALVLDDYHVVRSRPRGCSAAASGRRCCGGLAPCLTRRCKATGSRHPACTVRQPTTSTPAAKLAATTKPPSA